MCGLPRLPLIISSQYNGYPWRDTSTFKWFWCWWAFGVLPCLSTYISLVSTTSHRIFGYFYPLHPKVKFTCLVFSLCRQMLFVERDVHEEYVCTGDWCLRTQNLVVGLGSEGWLGAVQHDQEVQFPMDMDSCYFFFKTSLLLVLHSGISPIGFGNGVLGSNPGRSVQCKHPTLLPATFPITMSVIVITNLVYIILHSNMLNFILYI